MRSTWGKKINKQKNERSKGARWAGYARRESGDFGTDGVEDPGRDKVSGAQADEGHGLTV